MSKSPVKYAGNGFSHLAHLNAVSMETAYLPRHSRLSPHLCYLIFHTPYFPHSILSTLRILHTPHSPHAAFSTLLIFHIPHSALHTFHWTIQCRQFNEFITLPSVLLSCVFDFPPLLLQISLFPCDSRVSLIGSFTAGEQIFSEMSLINIIRK